MAARGQLGYIPLGNGHRVLARNLGWTCCAQAYTDGLGRPRGRHPSCRTMGRRTSGRRCCWLVQYPREDHSVIEGVSRVLFDSGIHTGRDIIKGIAVGARASWTPR
ncbi:hypothetical protein BJV77DRAFT_403636 [Russula vinacea]|nr:hypothetical protein BJV77DRAFT_403636 [Russula vinacea]